MIPVKSWYPAGSTKEGSVPVKRTLTDKQKKTLSILAIVIFVLLSAALAWFVGRPIIRFARQPEQFRAWVDSHGAWGPLAYAAMVFLQVVVAVIPGEPLEIAGGYAFGAWMGTLLCLAGAVLGSAAVFALVRRWGRGIVEVFFPADKLEKLHFLLHTSPKRTALFWLIFTVPGTPKDLMTYVIGLTEMSIPAYILLTTVARFPSIISSTVGGGALGDNKMWFAVVVFLITGAVSLLGYLLYLWIQKRSSSSAHKDEACRSVCEKIFAAFTEQK